jgi:hypothetical protein
MLFGSDCNNNMIRDVTGVKRGDTVGLGKIRERLGKGNKFITLIISIIYTIFILYPASLLTYPRISTDVSPHLY